MNRWLLDRYASSIFNTCGHMHLRGPERPERNIYVAKGVRPYHTAAPAEVPPEWRMQIKESLEHNKIGRD